jgi:LDH2 family malate/lactate/ureidoglycolate dehydrogenase
MTPGEPEWRSRERRNKEGIPIPEATNRAINELAAELGAQLS